LNDPARLAKFDDAWYRSVIANGRPAKGMPTWGTVLSPAQLDDLVALIGAWRQGQQVAPSFSVTDLLGRALFALTQNDPGSATLQARRALGLTSGASAEVLRNALAQLQAGDNEGARATLQALSDQWPLGDAASGAALYSANCQVCHGSQGEGGIGKPLHPSAFVQSQNNSELVKFIGHGRPGTAMAGFTGRLSDGEMADLVAFLREWQK
jgi:mono/diheme cytochrome c family protein